LTSGTDSTPSLEGRGGDGVATAFLRFLHDLAGAGGSDGTLVKAPGVAACIPLRPRRIAIGLTASLADGADGVWTGESCFSGWVDPAMRAERLVIDIL
jgi:hypothetical protein